MTGRYRTFFVAQLGLMALCVSACTASKEYADRVDDGAAGSPSEGNGDGGTSSDGTGDGGNRANGGKGHGGSSGSGGDEPSSDAGGSGGDEPSSDAGGSASGASGGSEASGGEAGATDPGSSGLGGSASGQCGAGSDGNPCGEPKTCTAFSPCTAEDVCALTGEQSRTCTEWKCEAGECREHVTVDPAVCDRQTEENPCGDVECGEWSECTYEGLCSNGGFRTRSCNDHRCVAGVCQAVPREETDSAGCTRNTDGASCGDSNCASCSFANSCDAQAEKWCTNRRCSGGACTTQGFSSTTNCPTQEVCSPGAQRSCRYWDDDVCDGSGGLCTGRETCNDACGWNACVRVPGGCAC